MAKVTPCEACGEPFTHRPMDRGRRFCSARCQNKARGSHRRPEVQCPVCLRRHRPSGLAQTVCSWECSRKARHIGEACSFAWHLCHCGAWYPKRNSKWHCSHPRTDVGRLANALQRVSCLLCGDAFLTRATTQRYCSVTCAKRAHKDTREARQRGATIERVHRQRVYERDGWVCQLCRRPVKRDAQVPHPLAPTLDHIIPLAAGGAHAYANVQLAHFLCNSTKSDGNAQLRWDIAA